MCEFFYDNKFTNITNNEGIVFTFSDRDMEFDLGYIDIDFDSDYYSLNERIENAQKNDLMFNQINKLTIII